MRNLGYIDSFYNKLKVMKLDNINTGPIWNRFDNCQPIAILVDAKNIGLATGCDWMCGIHSRISRIKSNRVQLVAHGSCVYQD